MSIIIKVGSITNAQRSRRILTSNGYKSVIKKIENPKAGEGCGYALLVHTNSNEPVDILKKEGINVKGVDTV